MAGIVQEVRARFSATAQGLMNSIRDMREGMQDFGDESREATQEANRGLNTLQDTLQDVETNVEGMADAMQEGSQSASQMGRAIVEEMTAAERMARMAETGMTNLRKTFLNWTAAAAGVGLIATGMGGLIVANEQYTQALNYATAATGTAIDEQAELGQVMQNIYKDNYGQDFQDIAESLTMVENATGLTGKALEDATKKAISLRDTFQYDVAQSTQVADTMMKQFGISSDQAFELIASGAQNGLDKSGDMLDSFNEYSVYFQQLGFDAEGMWNVFKAGSESGAFNADKVGDAIKELGIRVKDGSKTTADGFAALGLNADEMAQKFAAGGDSAQQALAQTFEALAKIEDPVARNTAGVALFGTQFEDLEYETIAALGTVQDQANMTGDAMEKINSIKYNSVSEAIQGIGRTILVDLINPMQGSVMPAINAMVNNVKAAMPEIRTAILTGFNVIAEVFNGLVPIFENVFGILKNVAPAILVPLGLAFKGLTSFILPVITYVTDLIEKFTGLEYFTPILGGLIAGFAAYQIGVKLAAVAQAAWAILTNGHIIIMNAMRAAVLLLNSAWLANPIVLIVALLVGLGVALYMAWQKSETFREIVTKAWEGIKTGAKAVFDWFTVTLPAWIQSVIQWFTQLWNDTKAKVSEWGAAIAAGWESVKTGVSNFVTAIKNFFVNLYTSITTTLTSWVNSIVQGFNNMVAWVVGIITPFVEMIKQGFTNLVNNVKYIIEPFINYFIQSWENLKNLVLGIIGVFTAILTGDMDALKNALLLIWQTIKDQITLFVETIKEVALRIFGVMKNGITTIFTAVKDFAVKTWEALKTAISNAVTATKDFVVNTWNALKTAVSNAVTATKDAAVNGWNNLKQGVIDSANALRDGAINAWNNLKSSISNGVENIKSSVSNGFNNAKQAAVDAWNNLVNSVRTGVSNAVSTVTGMKDNIISTVRSINLFQIGKDIISGLVNGLGNMLGSLKSKAKEIADTVKNAIADKLKIKSPSRVMMGFGVNIGEGLRNGINSMTKQVGKVAGGMADAVTDNMGFGTSLDGALNTSATVTSLQTFKHVIDLLNVPDGVDEDSLKDMLLNLFKNPTVRRQIDRVNAENNLSYNRPMGAF